MPKGRKTKMYVSALKGDGKFTLLPTFCFVWAFSRLDDIAQIGKVSVS